MVTYKSMLMLISLFLILFSYSSQKRILSSKNGVDMKIYYALSQHNYYDLTESFNRQFYVITESSTPLDKMVIVHKNKKGDDKAYQMNSFVSQYYSDGKYHGVWEYTLVWFSLLPYSYDYDEKFYFYGKIGSTKYIYKDDGDYFLLKENGDGLLGEDIEGKIYEGSINTSLYSSSCSGKILAKKGTESVKVTFNINGVGQKTVKATKVSSLDGDTEIWSFSYVVNSYVTSLSSVYVTIDDYLDNNFGKNYIISESYGLES